MMLAHDAVAPSELWSSWHPEPTVVAGLVLVALLYGRGLARRRARRRGGMSRSWRFAPGRSGHGRAYRRNLAVRPAQVAAFTVAFLALAVALASPLDTAASSLFTAHMIQHLLLIVVAAPLLVLGRPALVLTAALPARGRRLVHRARARPAVRRGVEVAGHPAVVWALGAVVLWAWHLPSLYEAAVEHEAVHALEHVTLIGAAAWLWVAVLGRGRRPLAPPAAVVLLFATGLQSAALGAVLSFAQVPLYSIHEPVAPLWDLTPLQDQQIAGGLMWVPPGLVYFVVMAGLLARWLATLGPPADEPAIGAIARES